MTEPVKCVCGGSVHLSTTESRKHKGRSGDAGNVYRTVEAWVECDLRGCWVGKSKPTEAEAVEAWNDMMSLPKRIEAAKDAAAQAYLDALGSGWRGRKEE